MTRRQSSYTPPPGKPQALPANCACTQSGQLREGCRAGVVGQLYREENGELCWRFPPTACQTLDIATLIDQDVPARVLAKHRRKSWSAYKRGRRCSRCPSPIVDHSRTGLCGVCYRAGRYVRGRGE